MTTPPALNPAFAAIPVNTLERRTEGKIVGTWIAVKDFEVNVKYNPNKKYTKGDSVGHVVKNYSDNWVMLDGYDLVCSDIIPADCIEHKRYITVTESVITKFEIIEIEK